MSQELATFAFIYYKFWPYPSDLFSADVQILGNAEQSPVGTGTEVIDQRPVTLGETDARGKTTGGTLLEVDSSGGSPAFVKGDELEAAGEVDCFAMRTRPDFTLREAKISPCPSFPFNFISFIHLDQWGMILSRPHSNQNLPQTSFSWASALL